MFGLHFTDTVNGKLFSQAATPLGLAIPIYTAVSIGGGMPIWNNNSNVLIEMVSVDINFGSGTSDFGAIGIMALPLASIATAALCTAFAATTPVNGFLGGGQASRVLSSNAGTVTVTAGVATAPSVTAPGWLRGLASINLEANTGTAHGVNMATYNFNGTLCVPPNWMIYLACTKATVALFASSVVWKEHTANTLVG